jgi:hypothetical protein
LDFVINFEIIMNTRVLAALVSLDVRLMLPSYFRLGGGGGRPRMDVRGVSTLIGIFILYSISNILLFIYIGWLKERRNEK